MTLMQHLSRLYDVIADENKDQPPLPVAFSEQNAQVVVVLDQEGEWVQAFVKSKEEMNTLIPVTISSASRTSGAIAHPLFDKLQYVAGDLLRYVDPAKLNDRKTKTITESHEKYLTQLDEWLEFLENKKHDLGHNRTYAWVKSIRSYVGKGSLVRDLIQSGILIVDEDGYLNDKPDEKTELLRLIASQQDTFVEFRIFGEGKSDQINLEPDLQRSFREFFETTLDFEDFCMIAGETMKISKLHPKRIRHAADGAKLISANDEINYTYRGRFEHSGEALSIGYSTSERSHSALKWLITKQGYRRSDRVFVTFSTKSIDAIHPLTQPDRGIMGLPGTGEKSGSRLGQSHHENIRNMLSGYRSRKEVGARVVSLILDAATPGRLSILFYRELDENSYYQNLQKWYERFHWELQRWDSNEKKFYRAVMTPTPMELIYAAYGDNVSDTLIKSSLERVYSSIVDGKHVPTDIVHQVVDRAKRPMGKENYEWEKLLRIGCALIHQRYSKDSIEYGEDAMEHYLNKDDRSTLYGRLLAVADFVEGRALNTDEKKRPTNAMRLMTAFSNRPFSTWKVLNDAVRPYLGRGEGRLQTIFDKEVSNIMLSFREGEYELDKPLDALFLMGYYTQREKMWTPKSVKQSENNTTNAAEETGGNHE